MSLPEIKDRHPDWRYFSETATDFAYYCCDRRNSDQVTVVIRGKEYYTWTRGAWAEIALSDFQVVVLLSLKHADALVSVRDMLARQGGT